MIRRRWELFLLICGLVLTGCGRAETPTDDESSILTWSSGSLNVSMVIGPAPENIGGFQELGLEITTAGTEPAIEFPDFTAGGFKLNDWTVSPPLAGEEKTSYRYEGKLEPLGAGELFIPPMRILSGDEISDMIISEGIRVTVPSLLSQEEIEGAANGQFPESSPLDTEPENSSRTLILILIGIGTAGAVVILAVVLKRRKKKIPALTPSEAALRKTETLNPENYTEFYTRAVEIIRENVRKTEELREILEYYELAAYTGRLGEDTGLPRRSPHEDKTRMMVVFTQMDDGGEES